MIKSIGKLVVYVPTAAFMGLVLTVVIGIVNQLVFNTDRGYECHNGWEASMLTGNCVENPIIAPMIIIAICIGLGIKVALTKD